MNLSIPKIEHDQNGFAILTEIFAQAKECWFETIDVDMSTTNWFDADMCAPFGAILYRLSADGNTINLLNLQPQVEKILSKNGFLSHYGRQMIPDTYGTTIPYRRFDTEDDRFFATCIESELVERKELPKMSSGLVKKFRESIFEIFSNAVTHSKTKHGIYSCGQYFPARARIDFSIADLGIGIRQNVLEHVGLDLSPEKAIDWATQGKNTTRRGSVPGGLGLKILCEFIDLNGGCITIVSDAGFWKRNNKQTSLARLKNQFPGTVACIEINTADRSSYQLKSEIDPKNIF